MMNFSNFVNVLIGFLKFETYIKVPCARRSIVESTKDARTASEPIDNSKWDEIL